MFAKINNGVVSKYPYTRSDLENDWPNTSFPRNLEEADLSPFDVARVTLTEPPTSTPPKMVREGDPRLEDGHWVQTWEIVDAPPALMAEWIVDAWNNLRTKRNRLLADSDWTQVLDTPVDHLTWAAYRQALRDLPDNTVDPFNPVWPDKP